MLLIGVLLGLKGCTAWGTVQHINYMLHHEKRKRKNKETEI